MGLHFYKIFKGKKANKKVVKKKKSGEKKQKEKKCQTKKCPALLILLYFLPLITGPYDLTIASVVSVLGFGQIRQDMKIQSVPSIMPNGSCDKRIEW